MLAGETKLLLLTIVLVVIIILFFFIPPLVVLYMFNLNTLALGIGFSVLIGLFEFLFVRPSKDKKERQTIFNRYFIYKMAGLENKDLNKTIPKKDKKFFRTEIASIVFGQIITMLLIEFFFKISFLSEGWFVLFILISLWSILTRSILATLYCRNT